MTPDEVAAAAQLACLLEASAPKPGNVSPRHAFHDMRYGDFLRSAVAIGPAMRAAASQSVGATVLAAIEATRRRTRANTNLGIVLLFAPLARAALIDGDGLRPRVSRVLRELTIEDARLAYRAIRLAAPGGFETAAQHDIRDEPSVTLLEAMRSAADRDSIAAEYASDFALTFEHGVPTLQRALARADSQEAAIVQTYLELLAAVPDTLIARKRGTDQARAVSAEAARVIAAGGVFTGAGRKAIAAFDGRLRDPRNQLNPGTTADLVAATLFVALLEGIMQ